MNTLPLSFKGYDASQLEKLFEEEIKQKAPQITNLYFVQGKDEKNLITPLKNYMMDSLQECHGGLHCMSLEEPDFEKWG